MHTPPRILVVDDTPENLEIMTMRLQAQGYDIATAVDGEDALDKVRALLPDLILLDIMMPKLDGIAVTKRLKADASLPFMPIVLLTAKADSKDVVAGLDAGADDYLTKPFSFVELLARMRALIRRKQFRPTNVLEFAGLVLDLSTHRCFRAGIEIHLSLTEFRLLELLVRRSGRTVSRNEILTVVWGPRREVSENTLDAFVRLLRKKVDADCEIKLIQTHRGFGYSVALPSHP